MSDARDGARRENTVLKHQTQLFDVCGRRAARHAAPRPVSYDNSKWLESVVTMKADLTADAALWGRSNIKGPEIGHSWVTAAASDNISAIRRVYRCTQSSIDDRRDAGRSISSLSVWLTVLFTAACSDVDTSKLNAVPAATVTVLAMTCRVVA